MSTQHIGPAFLHQHRACSNGYQYWEHNCRDYPTTIQFKKFYTGQYPEWGDWLLVRVLTYDRLQKLLNWVVSKGIESVAEVSKDQPATLKYLEGCKGILELVDEVPTDSTYIMSKLDHLYVIRDLLDGVANVFTRVTGTELKWITPGCLEQYVQSLVHYYLNNKHWKLKENDDCLYLDSAMLLDTMRDLMETVYDQNLGAPVHLLYRDDFLAYVTELIQDQIREEDEDELFGVPSIRRKSVDSE